MLALSKIMRGYRAEVRCDRGDGVASTLALDRGIWPCDSVEQRAQAGSSLGVDALDEGDAASEMCAEVRMVSAVLCGGPGANAVGEDRFELVEIAARNIGPLINNQAGEMLARGRAHQPRLAVMDLEALFDRDGGYVHRENARHARRSGPRLKRRGHRRSGCRRHWRPGRVRRGGCPDASSRGLRWRVTWARPAADARSGRGCAQFVTVPDCNPRRSCARRAVESM